MTARYAGTAGLLPAVPLDAHAQRPGAGRQLKACPPKRHCGRNRVFEVRTKLTHFICAQTRIASPSVLAPSQGLSVRPCGPSAPAVLDRLTVRDGTILNVSAFAMAAGPLPFRAPTRVSKRNKFRSPLDFRDAQRRADKLGRHARCAVPIPLGALCQGPFHELATNYPKFFD